MTRRNSGDYAVVWPRSAKAVEIKALAAFEKRERDKWGPLIKAAGLKGE